MTQKSHNGGEFFVVGGPVQPDRPCYVTRDADERLRAHLQRGGHCHVLAPRQSGKTSLMARTARSLRKDGCLVAVVDLTQIGSKDKQYEPRRWYYGLAYRIVRDLRLKVDLQAWWRAKENLPNGERLLEFFWEVVLANTTASIVVFFDELEALMGLPYAGEFLDSLRACHDRRATEPDFLRLSFVLLGVAAPSQLRADSSEGFFEVSSEVRLRDFSSREIAHFGEPLGVGTETGQQVLHRVLEWTAGQPYLTQKLCRAIARRGIQEDAASGVDALAESLFLGPNCLRDEPHLSSIQASLLEGGEAKVALLTLYGRLCKGAQIGWDPGAKAQQVLELSGLVTVGARQQLVIRNRIYERVFTASWVNQSLPFEWRVVALAGVVILVALLVPLWYTQILPRPYVETLSAASEDYEVAQEAYASLRRVPGFAKSADRLLAGFLERRVLNTDDFQVAISTLAQLKSLPGREAEAERLLAAFWNRRAWQAETMERRDAAILYRLEALAAGDEATRRSLRALQGNDYPALETTIRPVDGLDDAVFVADGSSVITLTGGNRIRRWLLPSGQPVSEAGLALLAQEFVPVTRRLEITEGGLIGGMELTLTINHARPEDLYLVLSGPGGRVVELNVGSAAQARELDYIFNTSTFAFNTNSHQQLGEYLGAERTGVWTLTVEDQGEGVTGTLVGWGLQFTPNAVEVIGEQPEGGLLLPDPRNTDAVRVELAGTGRFAAATAFNDLGRGYVVIWDLVRREPIARVPERSGSSILSFAQRGLSLVVASTEYPRTEVWHAQSGELSFEVELEGRFATAPGQSVDGRFLVVSALAPDDTTTLEVWDLQVATRQGGLVLPYAVTGLAVAGDGQRVLTASRDNLLRVYDVASGKQIVELFHESPVTRMDFDRGGDWVLMTARDGYLRAWDLRRPAAAQLDPSRRIIHRHPESLIMGLGPGEVLSWPSAEAARLVELDTAATVTALLRHADGPSAEAAAPGIAAFGEGRLATGQQNGLLRIWNLENAAAGSSAAPLRRVAAVSRDGRRAAFAEAGGTLILARMAAPDGPTPTELARADAHVADISLLRYSPAGSLLLSADSDGGMRVWNTDTAKPLDVVYRNDLGPLADAAFNVEGTLLLTTAAHGARLWRVSSGAALLDLGAVPGSTAVAMSQNGHYVALQAPDGKLQVLDGATGGLLSEWSMDKRVNRLEFTMDGAAVVAAAAGGSVEVWLWTERRRIGSPLQLGSGPMEMALTPNGLGVVMQSDGWMHLVAIAAGGPLTRSSLILGDVPGAAPPGFADPAGEVVVLPAPRDLGVLMLSLDGSHWSPLETPPATLRSDWQRRLGLAIGPTGELEQRGFPPEGQTAKVRTGAK